jgi:hypothetical protein
MSKRRRSVDGRNNNAPFFEVLEKIINAAELDAEKQFVMSKVLACQ